MAEQLAAQTAGRNLKTAIRYVLGVALGVLVLLLLVGKRGDLVAAWRQLRDASLGWVLLAVLAEAMSLLAFAFLQHRVLRLSGARIAMPALFLLTLANDAIANTVPGEPAVSSAYRYRYYRRRGATGASAGWTVFTILIAQAIGMAALLLAGVLVALASSTTRGGAGTALVGLVIVVAAGAVLVRRDLVIGLAGAAVRGVRRLTGHPRGNVGARIEATLARMREIPLSKQSTIGVVAIATAVWCCDFLCLVCAFGAVHAAIPWDGVLLAYGVAQVVGSLPIVPGGIGVVEGSLAVILAAYGSGRVPAVSAALGFRIVNFWLAITVGWVSVAAIALLARRRADAAVRLGPGGDLQAVVALPPD
ncbi:MAG: lysylphosphatidylglycerol synthase transmembrane domain-containing protein [Streptosporangiaceae bacterium]